MCRHAIIMLNAKKCVGMVTGGGFAGVSKWERARVRIRTSCTSSRRCRRDGKRGPKESLVHKEVCS